MAEQEQLTHGRNCPANTPLRSDECHCGLTWRIQAQTEQTMHNAWRKRAEEAELFISRHYQPVVEGQRLRELAEKGIWANIPAVTYLLSELEQAEQRIAELEGALRQQAIEFVGRWDEGMGSKYFISEPPKFIFEEADVQKQMAEWIEEAKERALAGKKGPDHAE